MSEEAEILMEILDELKDINRKLDDINGSGVYNLQDIHDKLSDISFQTDNLDGIREKLEDLENGVSHIETQITLL